MTRTRMPIVALLLSCLYPAAAPAFDVGGVAGSTAIILSSGPFTIIPVGEKQRIDMEGVGHILDPGKPLLPQRKFLIALPPGARVRSVDITGIGGAELPGTYQIAPAPPLILAMDSRSHQARTREMEKEWQANYEAAYSTDREYPAEIGRLAGSGTLRKYAYVSVSFCPFRYHPRSGRLVHYTGASVVVNYALPSPGSSEELRVEESKRDTVADERASRLFVNFEDIRALYQPREAGSKAPLVTYDYVIITTATLASAVSTADFVAWKTALGHQVRTVLTVSPEIAGQPGADLAERIRNFLREYYEPWGIRYVLLVGDYGAIPMRYCFPDPNNHYHDPTNVMNPGWSTPTDQYYADLSFSDTDSWDFDGDLFYGEYGQDLPDFLAEISVGRIPTSNASRVTYTLDKLVRTEQDVGSWKRRALHAGPILAYENEDHGGGVFCEGATCMDSIETALMSGWNVSRYSEQEGLVLSSYPWLPVNHTDFPSDWQSGQYGVVNWAGHGNADGAYRSLWTWDDGDGVAERDGSDGYELTRFVGTAATFDDDYPSIVCAACCNVGYPEPNVLGNFGVDLLTDPSSGAAAAVVCFSRPSAYARRWPATLGGIFSLCLDFNRFMIAGPAGPERIGDALYDAKYYVHQNYGFDHWYEYLNMYGINLYGDPAMDRRGILTDVAELPEPVRQPAIRLEQNVPNPFNPTTAIGYTLPSDGRVKLEIFDTLGRTVATLVDERQEAGRRVVRWDAGRVGGKIASGVYFYRITWNGKSETRRMVLLR